MTKSKFFAVSAVLATVAGAQAVLYVDPVGDVFVPGNPFPHMDITTVNVTNTASTITFDITLNGSPIATNWGKYNVVLRKVGASPVDNDSQTNPWGRNYALLGGASGFIGSWVDATPNNQQNWSYNGSWNLNSTVTNTITPSGVSLTVSMADLGFAFGDMIVFDVLTTGGNGGDTAVDSLSGASPVGWGDHVLLEGIQYNTAVPEPATMAVLGLGAAALLRRRKK